MRRPILRLATGTVIISCLLAAILSGCPSPPGAQPPEGKVQARVLVTRNFGGELILDEAVTLDSGASAMDALRQVAEVETAHGGSFVSAINGVSSKYAEDETKKEDWFLYFNGILANTGPTDYTIHSGDIEHWDFHDWGFRMFVPALIGNFPEPFLHGYGGAVYPTVIAYQDGWDEDAARLADKLSQLGVTSIATRNINELSADEKESANLILLGTADFPLIAELNQAWDKVGFSAHFEDGSLSVFDPRGELAAEYGAGTGLIQATQSPWNPGGIGVCENVAWMVSGTDEPGVKSATDILINHFGDFSYAHSAVIADGKIIRVPQ